MTMSLRPTLVLPMTALLAAWLCAAGAQTTEPATAALSSSESTTSTEASPSSETTETTETAVTEAATSVTLPSGVVYQVLQPGTGEALTTGATALIHYKLTSDSGEVWDNSRIRPVPRPFSFESGGGRVVRGMDEGTLGMRIGEKRKLFIPPSAGYGDRKVGGIPPNSNLHFEVELVNIKRAGTSTEPDAETSSEAQTTTSGTE